MIRLMSQLGGCDYYYNLIPLVTTYILGATELETQSRWQGLQRNPCGKENQVFRVGIYFGLIGLLHLNNQDVVRQQLVRRSGPPDHAKRGVVPGTGGTRFPRFRFEPMQMADAPMSSVWILSTPMTTLGKEPEPNAVPGPFPGPSTSHHGHQICPGGLRARNHGLCPCLCPCPGPCPGLGRGAYPRIP